MLKRFKRARVRLRLRVRKNGVIVEIEWITVAYGDSLPRYP